MIQDTPAHELWKFFKNHTEEIAAAYASSNYAWLDQNFSPLVKAIAEDMNWEIGPYNFPDQTFVLSPTTRENLSISRAAITLAPSIYGWVFASAKPAKQLRSLFFEARDYKVNADEWRYRMTSYNGGEFVDIELFFEPSCSPPQSHEDLFCELIVEALLGEELRLDRVGYLTPMKVPDVRAVEKASDIRYLKEHIGTVLSPMH